jgi:flagellar basal-body rod modification protein FlgD
MSTTPITSASGLASAAAAASPSSTSGAANEDIFLQLLVAQLKYQDPSQPASGTEFVTQLATFSQLQEDTESASDLDSILGLMQSGAASTAASTPSTASSTGSTAASDAATAAAGAAATASGLTTATGVLGGTSPTSGTTGF